MPIEPVGMIGETTTPRDMQGQDGFAGHSITLIEGTDAMRVRVITIGLALAIGCSSLGCKSAPKMSWWKSGDKAEATTTAQAGAPQLPSEMAKQAEALATAATPVQISTPAATAAVPALKSTAPAYTASTAAPSAYPSTGAPGYVPTTSASTSTAASSKSIAAVSSALPYNPAAVPPAASSAIASTAAATNAAASAQADRYANAAQDRYAYPASSTPAYPTTPTASYPMTASTPAPAAPQSLAATPATSVPFASNPNSTTSDNRYATQPAPTNTPISTNVPSTSTPVQTASAMASVQPYRPGGTSTYPGTSASYEVATRPDTTTNTASPSSNYPAPSGTQYR